MKQILNMYRMVKIAEQKALERDDQNEQPGVKFEYIMENLNPKIGDIKMKYREQYHVTASGVNGVFDDCTSQKWGYLETKNGKLKGIEAEMPLFVVVTTQGRKLLDTIPGLPFVPKGLMIAWYNDDGKIIMAMLGTIITLLGIIAVTLIKIAYQLYHGQLLH